MRSLLLAALVATAAGASIAVPQRRAVVRSASTPIAMVLPNDNLAEIVLVEGGVNFLSLYSGVLTLRILLSWFPQAQGIALLRPVFTVSDVYLNLFRGVVPPIGGIDISPIGAFFVLNLLQGGVASLAGTGAPVSVKSRPLPGSHMMRRLRERVAA